MSLNQIFNWISEHWGVAVSAIVAALVIIALFIGFKSQQGETHWGSFWYSGWVLVLGAVIFVVMMVAAATAQEFLSYFVFALTGGAMGWIIGMIASPSSPEEARIFGEYKTAIVGFLSGFAASKVSSLWDLLTKGDAPKLFQRAYVSRLLLFAGTFCMLAAQQYVVRQGSAGRIFFSFRVEPPSALLMKTEDTVAVRPGASITLGGAADYDDTGIDWTIHADKVEVFKLLSAEDGKVKDNTIDVPRDVGVEQTAMLRATSRWNRSKFVDVKLTIRPEKANNAEINADHPNTDSSKATASPKETK